MRTCLAPPNSFIHVIYIYNILHSFCLLLHRYDEKTNELINDKLGVAYPITDGIPQLAPEDGRLLQTGKNQSDWST